MHLLLAWRFGVVGKVIGHIKEITLCHAWLVLILGWVTVYRWVNHLRMQQPPRSTQDFHLCGMVKWVSAFGLR